MQFCLCEDRTVDNCFGLGGLVTHSLARLDGFRSQYLQTETLTMQVRSLQVSSCTCSTGCGLRDVCILKTLRASYIAGQRTCGRAWEKDAISFEGFGQECRFQCRVGRRPQDQILP